MKKMLFVAFIVMAGIQAIYACTTFFINKNGQFAFGRNYDWITDAGMVCTNLKGLAKTSLKMPEGSSIKWVSKYGSITFNQYGKEFPNGGMNEKGLVVEMMWLDGTEYPKPDKRPAMYVLQWIQYQLDNCASVKEVLATNKKIRISQSGNAPVHYLVADAGGDVATVEFLEGKLVVHRGNTLPYAVLTNTAYATSSKLLDIESGDTTIMKKSVSYNDNSIKRFASACSMVKKFNQDDVNKSIIDYSFDILNNVYQPEFTKWSIVYDLTNKMIYFRTASYTDIKTVAFSEVNLNCSSGSLAYNMNQPASGNVSSKFTTYSDELNREIMRRAVTESQSQVPFTDDDIKRTVSYASTIKCGS